MATKPSTHTFDPSVDIPSLEGKVILITGTNTGLGKSSALELAKHNPAEIWMTARDSEKGQAAVAEVKQSSPGVEVQFLQLNLASFDSVKAAAKAFVAKSKSQRLDILLLNAGILGHKHALTEDGYEIHMGTNHLGHALLLKLLVPTLVKTATTVASKDSVRVVSLTSIGYKMSDSTIHFSKLRTPDSFSPVTHYVQSKLANILYAQEVAKHNLQFTTVSVHPGEVKTDLFSREPGDDFVKYLQTELVPKHATFTVDEGVKNQLWAATAQEGVESGKYYEPVGLGGTEEKLALDREMARQLWEWTQDHLEGQKL